MQRGKWLFVTIIICFCSQMICGQEFEMMHDGIMRTYVVYEPNLEPNPDGYPLIIGLHGAGSEGYEFIGTAFLIQKAIKEKFIIACPDSLLYPMAWWNAGDWYEAMTDGTDDLGFISELIDTMVVNYNVDTTRIYVMAHSNGSMMAYRVAAELSHKIAAIAVNSGQMAYEFEYCNPEFPVPIMHFHGLEDPICPYEGLVNEQVVLPSTEDVIEFWRQLNNCYSNPYTILDSNGILGRHWDSFDGNGDIILYTIEGWGHSWPRKVEPGIDATDVMWDFLKLHTRIIITDSNDWFVAPDGTALGDGSAEDPWSLTTAFSRPLIKPGDTIWLAGGTYTGPFVKSRNPAGTENAPIIYRAMPGQRVTLTTDDPNKPVLMNTADNIWFWGMEVTGEHLGRKAGLSVSGIEQESVSGVKYINMVVHDCPNGSGFNVGAIGTELAGCISYSNGYSGFSGRNCPNDVGGSTENLPWLRYHDCIAFDNFEGGFIHSSESLQLANILHRGCAAYGNGYDSGWMAEAQNFHLGGLQFDEHFVMQDCFTYFPADPFTNSTAIWGSSMLPMDGRVTIENNIFVGGGKGVAIDGWDQIIFQGNTCYTALGDLLDIGVTGDPNNCTIDKNSYYQDSDEFLYRRGTHYESLEAWQAATGWDANSVQIAGRPDTAWIHLRPNKYEPDRAHLVIYNWPGTDTVTVNMADLWPEEGQQYQYRIVNVENIWGEPAVDGVLTNGTIEIPMQGLDAPEFACYLVTRPAKCQNGESDEILFCFKADGEIISTPAIDPDGTIYFGTQNATLYAVDCNGRLKWKWKYDCNDWWCPQAFESSPAIGEDGTIYVADDIAIPNYLFAISPEGEKKWEYVTYMVYGSMDALSDGTIFAGGYGCGRACFGQLVALTPDGTVLEGFPLNTGPILASPVVVDDVVIVGMDGVTRTRNEVIAVNKSADILWNTELPGDVDESKLSISSLAVDHDKNILIAQNIYNWTTKTFSSEIIQLNPLNGQILFEMDIPTESIVVGSPVIDAAEFGANVIVATQNGHVISINPYADGEKLNYDLVLGENSEAVGSPVIGDNGKLYHAVNSVGDANQIDIFEINADGTINDAFGVTIMNDLVSSSLTMGNNGVLYFGTKQGILYAVQTGANGLSSDAPWPTFRHDTRNTGNSGRTLP